MRTIDDENIAQDLLIDAGYDDATILSCTTIKTPSINTLIAEAEISVPAKWKLGLAAYEIEQHFCADVTLLVIRTSPKLCSIPEHRLVTFAFSAKLELDHVN